MATPIHYLKEVRAELKKVNWPNRAQTIKYTVAVLIISIALALFFGALDYGFGWILNNLII